MADRSDSRSPEYQRQVRAGEVCVSRLPGADTERDAIECRAEGPDDRASLHEVDVLPASHRPSTPERAVVGVVGTDAPVARVNGAHRLDSRLRPQRAEAHER